MYSGVPMSVVTAVLLAIVFSPFFILLAVDAVRARRRRRRLEWAKAFEHVEELKDPDVKEEFQFNKVQNATTSSSPSFVSHGFGRRKRKRQKYQPQRPGTSYVKPRPVHWSEKVDDDSVSLMEIQQAYVNGLQSFVYADRIHGVPGFGLREAFGSAGEAGTKSEVRAAYKLDSLTYDFPYVEIFHSVVLRPPYDIDHVIVMGWMIILVDDKNWVNGKEYVFSVVDDVKEVEERTESSPVLSSEPTVNVDGGVADVSSVDTLTVDNVVVLADDLTPLSERLDEVADSVDGSVESEVEVKYVVKEPSMINVTRNGEWFAGSHITVHRNEHRLNKMFVEEKTKGFTVYSIVSVDCNTGTVLRNETNGEVKVVPQYNLVDAVRSLLNTNGTHFFGRREFKNYCQDVSEFMKSSRSPIQ